MNETVSRRVSGRTRVVGLVAVLAVAVAGLSIASPALATPKGKFAVFSNCPLSKSEFCTYTKTSSGKFIIGKQEVPITNPVYIESGMVENPVTSEQELIGATNGKVLSHSPENVPGGLTDLVNCTEIKEPILAAACKLVFENKTTGVSATAELASSKPIPQNISNLLNEEGTVISLPLKIHLENTFLGSECYIGSSSSPINIPLTTGTTSPPAPNKPIKGTAGTLEFLEKGEINQVSNSSLVNNSFAAPGANGCGGILFSWILDPIIEGKLGIPAAGGHNTAVLSNATTDQATAESVKLSE